MNREHSFNDGNMKKIMVVLMAGLLLLVINVFADDVFIDSSGNFILGTSNTDANLEVSGASGEHGIVGETSGTSAAGVYGGRTDNTNYGILGYDTYGVYGYSSAGYAGYFQGDAKVTGNLTVDGTFTGYTETDPVFSAWDKSTGISITESQVTNLDHFTTNDEIDPTVNALGKAVLSCSTDAIVKWNGSAWICSNQVVYSFGDFIYCYSGPQGTMDTGICKAGTRQYNAQSRLE